ncbi:MAG: phosphoglycerate mutase [Alphaproteobacteria bacterium]|nr:phosphoglycerate mutase [Alphaproteobacteria bacterium]
MSRSSLRREITGILVIKIAIILLAGFTIFGAAHRLHVDNALMTRHLLGPSSEPAR